MASSLVNNKYRITRRIGGGSFGEIYMGVGPNNEKVAVKFERHGTRCPQLRHEYKVYRELTGCHGFCQVYHFGTQDNYNVMVMDLLGPSLEDLFNKCNRRFSLKTVLQIADQMLERVDTLHSRHLIHRDIKPANFVIGVGDTAANIYCVDFGLSKRYRHPKNLQHIPHRDGRSLTGTPRYASINNHLGIEQSRRDDLESIGYVLVYFLKGSLPWQGLKAKNAQKKYRLILEKKQQVSIAQLCQGCPSQFAEFLAYTRSLKFDAKPDVPYLRKLFRDLYHAQNCAAVPKLWDWDGMDLEFTSTAGGSAGGGDQRPPAIIPMSSQGLRPTTAAAVGGAMVGGGDDMLMGGGVQDDLDEDYEPRTMDRPNTAGAMVYNRGGAGAAGGNTWGYTRPVDASAQGTSKPTGSSGIADYGGSSGVDPSGARRPHTAHGGRTAGQPVYSAPIGSAVDSNKGGAYTNATESEDAHVVAGAREMMRYRRNRVSTNEGAPNAAGGLPVNNSNPSLPNNWAAYQTSGGAAKPTQQAAMTSQQQQQQAIQQQQMLAQQQYGSNPAMRKASAGAATGSTASPAPSGGWPSYSNDRPKSANLATGPMAGSSAPIQTGVSSGAPGARPSSSNGMYSSNAQWNGSSGAPVGSTAASNTGIASAANSNSLSYGSLKNRFLSGSNGNKTPTSTAGRAAPISSAAASQQQQMQQQSSKSKLFSLAR